MNAMLGMAKKRTKRGRDGGWMKRALPIVYDNARYAYQRECLRESMAQGIKPPKQPWEYWHLEYACFRLHSLRDPLELAAGLKWACDFLVKEGFVFDDSPRELHVPSRWPEQVIDRKDRGLDLVICRRMTPPTK
jgi:hypothetical protein